MNDVVVVGSLNADLVVRTERFPTAGETVAGADLVVGPGGKGANQAVAAARLGGDVAMVGVTGADAHGALVRDAVAAAGADVSRVATRDDTATGTAVITVDAAADNTIVVSPGANRTLTAADLPPFDGAAVLTLSLESPLETVLAAARAARAAGVTVLLNLSPFGPVPDGLLEATDVLVVNEHEAALLGEHPVPRSVVTRGARGCEIDDRGTTTTVEAPVVSPVDTTGSGDAFLAAVAVRLAAGDPLAGAARYAVRVGAFAVTAAGAQLPEITPAERERFGL
ncbi:Ribokinase [Pseudonocardia sp. Ae168_Ps1]|uniref:ribokinase n=1 Tax=unclassified Pseudonocardia TaxID=2619320 RepID=UPI0006CB31ED|nr:MULTISPECIES: ribokinase [unclassified Pseudonocardia]ALE76367.1 carbohydrate kinase [Pseudonocardia sp. EC080625-04]ALL79050.1 carbohydrate kinase [Pseudonocardia sp. EC080610-09]ALL84224.1 carbohydrate kinase [Pseudonocardia sp. EC080619-01]OLL71250.1 Ribokinase [Pseudonocardia sp. Ae168_Ps1]OLL77196.1 Ribokinase [Pseudonocardia sp. Ae150A_Ps1]